MFKLRVTVPYRFAIIALSLLMATSLTACKADSNYFATANASTGGGDGSTSDGTAGFRVRIKAKTGVDTFIHKFGDVAEACEIPLTAVGTPTSIQCMFNIMEYDLWFYGFEYEFNVPKDTCKFATISPNFHYDELPGYGPLVSVINTLDGALTSCTVDSVAGVPTAGLCVAPEGTIDPLGATLCAYNYNEVYPNSGGKNCCMGAGTVTVNASVTDAATGLVTTTSTNLRNVYGGHAAACMDSPHDYLETTDWPKLLIPGTTITKAGTVIVELGSGALVRSTKIPSSGSSFFAEKKIFSPTNFVNAGFHDWATYVASPATWDTARTVPRALQPLYDRGPSDDHLLASGASAIASAGDGSEEFRCLNGAGEVKLRIRMYTNEWNTKEDYDAYKAGGVASGADPTVRGTTGVNCSAVNTGPSCNTIWGFEDMLNENGAGLGAYEFPHVYRSRTYPP